MAKHAFFTRIRRFYETGNIIEASAINRSGIEADCPSRRQIVLPLSAVRRV